MYAYCMYRYIYLCIIILCRPKGLIILSIFNFLLNFIKKRPYEPKHGDGLKPLFLVSINFIVLASNFHNSIDWVS